MKRIILSQRAEKQLDSLPEPDRDAVGLALEAYAITGRWDIKRLAGREGYRMRVGACRVLFDEDRTNILAIFIGPRATTTYSCN
jgi:mRNA interferase RelE/StbE